jgi:hypothetical protein
VSFGVGIFRIGPDVLLDEGGQRRFGQVAVAVDPGVDQQVDVVAVPPRDGKAVPGRRHREVQCAVPVPPPPPGDLDVINDRAHGVSPDPRRR